jgi:signal peptidase I
MSLWVHKAKTEMIETTRTVTVAILLAVLFRSFAFEPFHIPSGSMKSNLLIGDYLFVSKYSYGYSRFSFPFGFKLFDGRILSDTRPQRGDVVVFRKPSDLSVDYIKRVVGLPGDTIQVRHSVLYINGQEIPRERLGDYMEFDEQANNWRRFSRYKETLPDGRSYTVLDDVPDGAADNTREFEVPAGHYFMMGDNRDHSADSRYLGEVGYVPEENLVGKAQLILFSSTGGFSFRAGRYFKWIE